HMGIIHEGRLLEEIAFDKLRERNRNYLEFQVSDDNKAIMLLESQFGISDYEVHAEGNICVYSHLGKQGSLNKAFVENGIEVLKSNLSEEGIDDYFAKLVWGVAIRFFIIY